MKPQFSLGWFIGLFLLLGIGLLGYNAISKSNQPLLADPEVAEKQENLPEESKKAHESLIQQVIDKPDEIVLGSPDAPVKAVNISSLSCPHCADFFIHTIPQLKRDYIDTGKLQLTLKEVAADKAAIAGLVTSKCMPASDYEKFTLILYQNQQKWAFTTQLTEKLYEFAKAQGMPREVFDTCITSEALIDHVSQNSFNLLKQENIKYTPTFIFVQDGDRIEGAKPYDVFKEAIDEHLKAH